MPDAVAAGLRKLLGKVGREPAARTRYLKLTGSVTTTVLLGALSYAALHVFEYWTVYDSVSHSVLSVIFVVLTFIGPGMIKSYLTLRTGNAWVHLWGYHAIAPHVTTDTPVVVRIFGIR